MNLTYETRHEKQGTAKFRSKWKSIEISENINSKKKISLDQCYHFDS